MTKPRRVTVRGIVFQDGKLLCQRLKPGEDGKQRDYWCTPGGGLEAGESLYEGLRREMIEETAIEPKIGKLLFVQQYQDEDKEYLEFFFHIENPRDYHNIDLTKASHGELEVEHVEFIVPKEHTVLPEFLQDTDLQTAIATKTNVLIANRL